MAGEVPVTASHASLTACLSKTRLILDKRERIVAVLVGQPADPLWRDTVDAASEKMREAEQLGTDMELFSQKSLQHRRGEFLAMPAGVSYGGGQTVRTPPGFLIL